MNKLEAMRHLTKWVDLQSKSRSRTTEVFISPISVRRLETVNGYEVKKHNENSVERQILSIGEIKLLKIAITTRLGRLFS